MQVSVKPYYTISSVVLLQQHGLDKQVIDDSVRLNILLDIPPSALPALFLLLGAIKNNYLFSLPASLISDYEMLKAQLPGYYILASLDNFYGNGDTIIPVLWDQPVQTDTNTDIIRDYFLKQGTTNVQLPFFNRYQTGLQQAASCLFYAFDVHTYDTGVHVFHPITIIAFATAITDLVTFNECTGLIKNNADSNHVSKNYVEKNIYEEEIKNWQQRALLYRNFLSLSKSVQQKEYYDVLDWYHKEYETLPLWYKRLGHIIKVIMGKRSLRSLFNDNTKKYKD
jgi:hypothetical protein